MDAIYLCLVIINPISAFIPPEWIFSGNHKFTIFVNYHVCIVSAKNTKELYLIMLKTYHNAMVNFCHTRINERVDRNTDTAKIAKLI